MLIVYDTINIMYIDTLYYKVNFELDSKFNCIIWENNIFE